MVTPDRWPIVEGLFNEALARPVDQRAAFLDSSCGGDAELRHEVEALLAVASGSGLSGSLAGEMAAAWAAEAKAESLIGRDVGSYRVMSLLGTGGMGEVYLAEDESLRRRVAVKVLPAPFASDGGRLRRFTDEARAASGLNHPNIITVYHFGALDTRPYIVTEFIDGETLRARLAAGPLPADAALDIAIQVGRALAAAHAAGIIHRDIKPENIMVRRDGYVKVLDWGLAKLTTHSSPALRAPDAGPHAAGSGGAPADATSSGADTEARTRRGVVLGTRHYMAPEQAMGVPVDARADLFSLAVVLHEMLTGALPAAAGGHATAGGTPRLSVDASRILQRGLAYDPGARYQTADEFVRDLEDLRVTVVGGPGRARRASWRRLAAGAVAAVAAMAITAVGARVYIGRLATTAPADVVRSLVVMPFRAIDQTGDQAYLEVGMQDALITRLGAISDLRVPPTAAVRADEDLFEAAARLGADAVLTGSVQRAAERLRVTVQLSRVADRALVWGDRFDELFSDIFTVQDSIAERVASSLFGEVSAEDLEALRDRGTTSVAAYELYLKAHEQWLRRTVTSVQTAIDLFQQAIRLDPGFARAHAKLAHAYATSASGLPPRTRFPLARAAAEQAVTLSPRLAEAHVALAYVTWRIDSSWAAAERQLRGALAIDPDYSLAYIHLGHVYQLQGQWELAIAAFQRAQALEPGSTHISRNLSRLLIFEGRIPEARTVIENALSHDPDSWEVREGLAEVLEAEGRRDESIDEELAARRQLGVDPAEIDALRAAYRTGGLDGYVKKHNEFLLARFGRIESETPSGVASSLAANFARLRDREQTIYWLQVAAERLEEAAQHLNAPWYDFVRDDARFQALHRQVFP